MEMIVDEMLAILNDRDAYVQKQIEKNRRIDLDDLFIRGFDIIDSVLMMTIRIWLQQSNFEKVSLNPNGGISFGQRVSIMSHLL